ncbi:MAG: hypothetical protein H0X24_08880 [Ktedonobacterales bacterium]|nr:hypothetical protein [Ktedonobacterales bacterium]
MSDEAKRWNESAKIGQIGSKLREHDGHLALFEQFPIRRTWHSGEWWYSIIDSMAPLSGSPNPRNYWSMMKKRLLKEEGLEVYTLGVHLIPLPDKRGAMQPTDCANAEILLRLIQSVKSPNAEPFKTWLARVGAMVMDVGEERPLRQQYRAQLDQSDRDLHELVEFHGVVTPEEQAQLNDANYGGLYNVACEMDMLRRRRTLPGALPETMGSLELAANLFQRELTAEAIRKGDIEGIDAIAEKARDVGSDIRTTIGRQGGTMPEDMPQYPPLPPGEWMPPNHPSRIQWDEPAEEVEGSSIPLIEINKPECFNPQLP